MACLPIVRQSRACGGARGGMRRRGRGRRGVSDVVATILILSLTVVLFAALFAFVSRFPAPPAQSVNQFQASVTHTSTAITGVSIEQEGGPPVPSTDRIYLVSTRTTTDWQFSMTNGVPVAWGTGNTSNSWATGQYWTTTFGTGILLPANITIYIVSATQLLYSGVVPGAPTNAPPSLTSTYTVPVSPAVGAAFQIVALVSGNTANLSVNISLSNVPGLPTAIQTMKPYGTGEWVYNVSAGLTTKNGSYLAFIQGATTSGATIAGSVTIVLPSTGGGGSTSSAPSASVSVSPNPPTVRTNLSLVTSVTNPTGSSLTVSNVTFYVNGTTNHTNLKTLYATGTLPTVAAHSSAGATSTAWMVPPAAAGGVNLTVLVTFSSGTHAVGASAATIGSAPFTVSISDFPQNSSISNTGSWNVLTTVGNFGSLGGSTVNITVYVNKSGTTTVEGTIVGPTGYTHNYGYATPATSPTLPAYSTPTFPVVWRGGGVGTTMTLSIVVLVKISGPGTLWNSFASPTLTILAKTTFSN